MIRLLAYSLAISLVMGAAWSLVSGVSRAVDEELPENDSELQERVMLARQRLAQQVEE